uniref:Photosystem II subunit O n=1 Tax=Mesostigma viride TaxID=41882 RepID=A0A7S4X3M9_MESVI
MQAVSASISVSKTAFFAEPVSAKTAKVGSAKIAAPRSVVCSAEKSVAVKLQEAGKAACAFALSAVLAGNANAAFTKDELNQLSYLDIKGTGLANTCAVIDNASTDLKVAGGKYKVAKFCLEPTSVKVKEESILKGGAPEFVDTKLLTRMTYTLDEISGSMTVGSDGSIQFKEEDGIDYAATTVQLPGGERVPFLFSVKELAATGNLNQWGGSFKVPSYRGATFLDPKGRGMATGYDTAIALPAGGDTDKLAKENLKKTTTLSGNIVLQTAGINKETNELVGIFESVQPSDTDLGAKVPKEVKIQGVWYLQLVKA